MRLSDASIRRPVFAVMLVGALVAVGMISIGDLNRTESDVQEKTIRYLKQYMGVITAVNGTLLVLIGCLLLSGRLDRRHLAQHDRTAIGRALGVDSPHAAIAVGDVNRDAYPDLVVAHDPIASVGAILDADGVVRPIDTSTADRSISAVLGDTGTALQGDPSDQGGGSSAGEGSTGGDAAEAPFHRARRPL